jgi:hypothetical protein
MDLTPTPQDREKRIEAWSLNWKLGDATPYPEFISDLRGVLDALFLTRKSNESLWEEAVKNRNGGPS